MGLGEGERIREMGWCRGGVRRGFAGIYDGL